jgi:hypothetical protein
MFAVLVAAATLGTMPLGHVAASSVPGAGLISNFAATSCLVGDTLVAPDHASQDADGWVNVAYAVPGGMATQFMPPAGFSPGNASYQILVRHGIPLRIAEQLGPDVWDALMSRFNVATTVGLCRSPGVSATGVGNAYDATWSGAEATYSSIYTGVLGQFIQPTLHVADCTNQSLASWVGLGGVGLPVRLLQVGTVQWSGHRLEAFWEAIWPGGDTSITQLPMVISYGDQMYAQVTYSGGSAYFYISDMKTGQSASYSYKNSSAYNGVSAEWVDERIQIGGQPINLEHFDTVSWTNLQTATTVWHGAHNEPVLTLYMTSTGSSGGTPLAHGSGISSSNTQSDYWLHC